LLRLHTLRARKRCSVHRFLILRREIQRRDLNILHLDLKEALQFRPNRDLDLVYDLLSAFACERGNVLSTHN
jgi:hypothetical protein